MNFWYCIEHPKNYIKVDIIMAQFVSNLTLVRSNTYCCQVFDELVIFETDSNFLSFGYLKIKPDLFFSLLRFECKFFMYKADRNRLEVNGPGKMHIWRFFLCSCWVVTISSDIQTFPLLQFVLKHHFSEILF